MSRTDRATIDPATVQVRPSDLLECWIVALESDEWMQLRNGNMRGRKHPRKACALGVLAILCDRAGMRVPPTVLQRSLAAAASLGFSTLDEANDAGVPFVEIARALRQAQ